MRRRFFVDAFQQGRAELTGEAANHLGRVLRAEPGQLYELSDGEALWLARTESVERDRIQFSLVQQLEALSASVRVALLLAIVKFDRMEWALEKATELGVDEVVPLVAARSEKGLLAAAVKRSERWRRILGESAQQARRLRVPTLRELQKPGEAFHAAGAAIRVLLSERSGAQPMRDVFDHGAANLRESASTSVTVAVGPEGGWTDEEFSAALAAEFMEASLGTNILRTETAVCAALAAVQYAFGAARPAGDVAGEKFPSEKARP